MDSRMSLSPLPQQPPFSVSPSSSPRKRSIHEISTENQENQDPSLMVPSKDISKPQEQPISLPPTPSVEITVRAEDLVMMSRSKETTPSCVPSVEAKPIQQPLSFSPAKSDSASTPAPKKRKLSPASQDAKQQEKEARERQKQDEKAKKEEERRLKAEEKKKRDEEREEEKKLKEEEKKKREAEREEKKKAKDEEKAAKEAAKEEEKKRKEEERLKKERAQPKLNSFFAKPPLPSTTSKSTPGNSTSPKKPAPATSELHLTHSPKSTKSTKSDYETTFPEFFLQSHTKLAPCHRFDRDPEALKHVRQKLDASLDASHTTPPHEHLPFRPSQIFHIIPFHRRCGRPRPSVKEILLRIQNVSDDSLMDLDGKDQTKAAEDARNVLRQIPMKTLRFGEDVRPPYQGTFSRSVPAPSAKKLARNPYYRGLPDINYDYDSEAEWEEPEEGEDLDSEEDEEGSDDGDDDMDGFLDDEDDALLAGKRRLIVGDLAPVSSGLRWAADGMDPEMKAYQIETISDAVDFPIDPFSTAYWEKPKPVEPAPTQPRIAPAGNSTLDGFRVSTTPGAPAVSSARPPATSKAKRPFPPEQLDEFRQAVEGSDLSKIGTIEILKKRFPKVSKETLKATLDQYAVRVGQKETDKKWVWR
ncbi:putative chromatin assembly factor 1 subunit A [Penicillium brasilianum]|uniref:Putative chromatin assembly factor 1 subunit A n=1 Tax=Penicillium brasilianum TaxID=104259 RepID=A0A1S9RJ63_PENBI|nr:putative chromatin assembly factor 1 subunit A [Penicillium brasilianum]